MDKFGSLFVKLKFTVLTTLIIFVLALFATNIIRLTGTSLIMPHVLLIYFGGKKWGTILIVSKATSLFIYFFFEALLNVPLPRGLIFA